MALVLNPVVRLRRQKRRNIVYKVDETSHEPDSHHAIPPFNAIWLALFDGTRSREQVSADFAYIVGEEDRGRLDEQIDQYNSWLARTALKLEQPLLVEKEELEREGKDYRVYNPEDFYIPSHLLDMRCDDMRVDFPLSVNYNVATSCSYDCRYCYHPRPTIPDFIPLSRLAVLFDEMAFGGVEHVGLTGGDPFDRPDFIEIMEELYMRRIRYFVSTKKPLSSAIIQRMVRNAGLDYIQISLDGSSQAVVASLLNCRDSYFEDIKRTISELVASKVVVRLKSVVTSANIRDMPAYLAFAKDMGVGDVHLVQYGRSAFHHPGDSLFASSEDRSWAAAQIADFRQANPQMKIIGGQFEDSFLSRLDESSEDRSLFAKRAVCNAGRYSLTMLPNGEVTVCEQLPHSRDYVIGDLRTQTLTEFWNGEGVARWLSPPDRSVFPRDSPCSSCEESTYQLCHRRYSRCLRYVYQYYGDANNADLNCPLAKTTPLRMT